MSRRAQSLLMALSVCLVAITVRPEAQAPRDSTLRIGTASVEGRVVSRDDGRPIARAAVVLAGSALIGLTTFTDEAGRFVFDGLPAGAFTLTASKSSWLTSAFGQSEPGRGSGLPLAVKDGENRRDVTWALARAGSIAGRVLDVNGQPLRGGVVALQQRRIVDGETKFVSCCSSARTDARGVYRLTGLLPGEYLVSAVPPGDYRFVGDGPAVYSEGMRQISDDEVRWALAALKSGDAPSAPATAPPASGRTVAFGRVYFGGAIDPARAAPVPIKLSEVRSGVDMTLQLVPTAMIQARAVMPDGQPPAAASFVFSDGWSSSGGGLAADGRFERRNLAPGRYRLTVRGRGASVSGMRVIDVSGEDLTDLVVTMAPAASLSGRIEFEKSETAAPDVTQVQVMLSPVNLLAPARASADGRWTLALVDPGRYRLNASLPAAARNAWTLKSITLGGRDVADAAFEVGSGDAVADVVITFTSRRTSLGGTLLTADGEPAAGFYVVVFSDDDAHWQSGSRRVPPPARAATDGRYQFAGLPPGTYRLAALTHVDQVDLADPAFLEALKASAIVVTLAEGESRRQDVKFGK